MDAAKKLLRSSATSAIALLCAADKVLGDYLTWEPETVWLELEHHGVETPSEVRDRLMAGIALRLVPAFYWDAIVYEKTCVAFDGRPIHTTILEEPTVAAIAWGVIEAAWIRTRYADQVLRPEHEPTAYTAVVLERAGFVHAPATLAFAQETLDQRLPSSTLATEVRRRWADVDQATLTSLTLQESPIDVQIARLAAVEAHIRVRRKDAEADLAQLA